MGLKGNAYLGELGFDVIADGNTYNSSDFDANGVWYMIKAINADAVIAECVTANGDSFTGTLDKGDTLFGQFTRFRLTSGKTVNYRGIIVP